MGAGGGAVVAIIAAARAKRMEDILDAYRVAAATSADRAVEPAALGLLEHESEIGDFLNGGVLVAVRGGTMYLDEAGYIAYRKRSSSKGAKVVFVVLLIAAAIIAVLVMAARGGSQ